MVYPVEPETIVEKILESRLIWDAVNTYTMEVLGTKEKGERQMQTITNSI